jgi:hypothetical protein
MNYKIIILSIFFFVILYFGARGLVAFNLYCEDSARASGRLNELYESKGTDENNLNKFQREIYKEIMSGHFVENDDPIWIERAHRLARQLKRLKILCIAFVVLIAFLYRDTILFSN